MASQVLGTVQGLGSSLASKGWGILDSIFPPEKRAELLERVKAFVLKNPKISAFLLTNVVLTGGPLVLFVIFSISIFVFALIVALVVALLAAVAFTLVAVGFALLILFPTIFFTTLLATFLFLWGLGGWYIFKYFNKGNSPGAKGDTLGDKLNSLTGNKLDFVMDNAREGHVERLLGDSQAEWKEPSPHHAPKQQANSTPSKHKKTNSSDSDTGKASGNDAKKGSSSPVNTKKVPGGEHVTNGVKSGANGVSGAAKSAGVSDHAEKVKGAPKKLSQAPGNVKGTVTGAVGGATGLT